MKVRIIGSGTSTGVPQIGCTCAVCTSADPKDNRLRASAIVETEDARILIDCGPDFREQVLHLPFEKIDGVLITHEHYDHVGGLDDLRPFCQFGSVPIYAEEYVARGLRSRMPYCFVEHSYPGVPNICLLYTSLRKVFEIFESYQTSIDMICTSEVGVSVTIDNTKHLNEILDDLKKYGTVTVDKEMCIICVVGDLEWENVGFEAKALDAMRDIPVRMISFGGSNYNISFLIRECDKKAALQSLSDMLFNGK